MDWSLTAAQKKQEFLALPVGKTIPWRHNGSRALSTGLARAYYAVFIEEIEVMFGGGIDKKTGLEKPREIRIHLQALGEWDLPHPATSLFCILDAASTKKDTWAEAAAQERKNKNNGSTSSRFFLGEWVEDTARTALADGYYKGYLRVPLIPLIEHCCRNNGRPCQIHISFGSSIPWKNDYAIAPILELELDDTDNGAPLFSVPLTSRPVSANDPWSPVFSSEVLARFLERFQK